MDWYEAPIEAYKGKGVASAAHHQRAQLKAVGWTVKKNSDVSASRGSLKPSGESMDMSLSYRLEQAS
jgi:hypothetical protein